MSAWKMCLLAALVLAGGLGVAGAWLASAPPEGGPGVPEGKLRPQWQVGSRWVVETVTRPLQVRGRGGDDKPDPLRWQFTVAKKDKLGRHECFLVEVEGLTDPKAQPRSLLWVDAKSLAVRQLQTQVPVPGGFTTITENYDFGTGQPAPVMAPVTVLPLELPVFV